MEGPPVTSDNIHAGRQQMEARRRREAVRIEGDRLTSAYEAEMSRLRELIAESLRECKEVMTLLTGVGMGPHNGAR